MMITNKKERQRLVNKATLPYTIIGTMDEGDDEGDRIVNIWRIQTQADERMFVNYANSQLHWSLRRESLR